MAEMTIHNALSRLESLQQEAEEIPRERASLEAYVRRQAGSWAEACQQAGRFSSGLREISEHYLAGGKRRHKHRLENFWDSEKIGEFYYRLNPLGLSCPHFLKESTIFVEDGRLLALDYNHLFFEFAVGWCGVIGGGVAGVIIPDGITRVVTGELVSLQILASGAVLGGVIGSLSLIKIFNRYAIKKESEEDPFLSTSNAIDDRVKEISEKMKAYI